MWAGNPRDENGLCHQSVGSTKIKGSPAVLATKVTREPYSGAGPGGRAE
jgi:hypothetical protein